jgi:VCBS repeat-containing protein
MSESPRRPAARRSGRRVPRIERLEGRELLSTGGWVIFGAAPVAASPSQPTAVLAPAIPAAATELNADSPAPANTTATVAAATTTIPSPSTAAKTSTTTRTPAVALTPAVSAKTFSVIYNGLLNVSAPGLLAGASAPDPAHPTLTASIATPVAHGTVYSSPDGSFQYNPNAGYFGPDSFTYTASDGVNVSAPATASITVLSVPYVTLKQYRVAGGGSLNVAAPGVLAGTTDPDPSRTHFSAVEIAPPAHGTLKLNADGSFVYTPNAGYIGTDSFSYAADDGAATGSPATVAISVLNAPTLSPQTYTTGLNHALSVAAPGVLAGSSTGDPSKSHVTPWLIHAPTHGALTLGNDGSFVYTPQAGFSGVDVFSVAANDGATTGPAANFTVNVLPAPRVTNFQSADVNGQSTRLTLTFDQPMWPVDAQFTPNYVVVGGSPLHQQFVTIASAVYNATNHTVVLTTSQRLDPRYGWTLYANGSAPFGLVSSANVWLDGAGGGSPGMFYIKPFTIGR